MCEPRYAEHTVGAFLDAVASRSAAPSAGAVVALTVAAAAGLAGMAARFAGPESAELANAADLLRHRLTELADADVAAYTQVLRASRLPSSDPTRRERLGRALRAATEVPGEMARAGVDVARLAGQLTGAGNPNLFGDARAAVWLAEAGVRAAAELVRINVRRGGLDESLVSAAEEHERAAAQAAQVLG